METKFYYSVASRCEMKLYIQYQIVRDAASCTPACPYVEYHRIFNKVTEQSRAVDSFTVFMSTAVVVDITIVTATCS